MLIAHSTFVGLGTFVEQFCIDTDAGFDILVPEWLTEQYVGYSITNGHNQRIHVSNLLRDFDRKNRVVVDDVVHTGQHLENIARFWGVPTADIPARFVSDLRRF